MIKSQSSKRISPKSVFDSGGSTLLIPQAVNTELMNLKRLIILTSTVFFMFGCRHNGFDAEYFAEQYCNCLQQERKSGRDFFDARTKCDGQLLAQSRFFRITYIENVYGRYMMFLPDALDGSAVSFKNTFYDYVEKNCCKEGLIGYDKNDSLQLKRKAIGTMLKHY